LPAPGQRCTGVGEVEGGGPAMLGPESLPFEVTASPITVPWSSARLTTTCTPNVFRKFPASCGSAWRVGGTIPWLGVLGRVRGFGEGSIVPWRGSSASAWSTRRRFLGDYAKIMFLQGDYGSRILQSKIAKKIGESVAEELHHVSGTLLPVCLWENGFVRASRLH